MAKENQRAGQVETQRKDPGFKAKGVSMDSLAVGPMFRIFSCFFNQNMKS